jgi:hypothetical protein
MPEVLPVHPFTGLTALGVLSSGRIVWPVLGGAPGDDGQGDDAGDGDGADGQGDDDQDGDGLGEKGRAALKKERDARKAAVKAQKAAEARAAELEAKQAKQDGEDTAATAEKTRRDAEAAANAKANSRILKAELRAAAAGKLADPSDAAAFIDLAQFEPDAEGNFDADEISGAISDLIKRKPHLAAKAQGFQGAGDGGARTNGSGPKQVTDAELKTMSADQIVQARREGRLTKLMNGG